MAELIAKSPCEGLLPFSEAGVTVVELNLSPLFAISPYMGKEAECAKAMKANHGLACPAPGQSVAANDGRLQWFGHSHMLLSGIAPSPDLSKYAGITDQSDAWAVIQIEGKNARDVLARLTPLDLRDREFAINATARTEIAHMQGAITRSGQDCFILMVFRSMAATLVHDLKLSMASVAAHC